jgi:DNA-binding NtrC family response regulator
VQWPEELRAGPGGIACRRRKPWGAAELERVLIDCALEQTGGQRIRAAELLGLGRNTLTRKLKVIGGNAVAEIQEPGRT